jgi:transposase
LSFSSSSAGCSLTGSEPGGSGTPSGGTDPKAATHRRSVRRLALARREIQSRFGENALGYAWTYVAPLAWIAATDPRLYRAYLLKEALRMVFRMPYKAAVTALDRWIAWARRCRIPAFVKLQKSIVKHRPRILAAIEHQLSNGLIESTNTKIRLITRMAYGFHSADALIALAMLNLGGYRPALPGRN